MKTNRIILLSYSVLSFLLIGCVQETHQKMVYFRVDASSFPEAKSVGIRGNLSPLSWDATTALTDADGDGVFTGEVPFQTASDRLSFKFVMNDSVFELEGRDNRVLPFEYKPETLHYNTTFDPFTNASGDP